MTNLILSVFKNQMNDRVPIWLMRQAGRYLPEYKKTRLLNKDFINFCLNTKDSTEVTMQPIKRFNFDAAIIFSDILLINYASGQKVQFRESIGPILEKLEKEKFFKIKEKEFKFRLANCYSSISNVRKILSNEKVLIGFAGAPWTLMVYALNLKSPKGGISLNYKKEEILEILDKFIDLISWHCIEQINKGADVIQLFDSWAGIIKDQDFEEYCEIPNYKIIKNIKKKHPDTPVVCFPRDIKLKINSFINNVKPDGINIDYNTDLQKLIYDKTLVYQGGMKPELLTIDNEDIMMKEAEKYLNFFKNKKYIFNLGHGILPNTKVENVTKLVNFVKSYN